MSCPTLRHTSRRVVYLPETSSKICHFDIPNHVLLN